MANHSSKSVKELNLLISKMRKWKNPTHAQLMEYLHICSEVEYKSK
jgi:hypothetical protein